MSDVVVACDQRIGDDRAQRVQSNPLLAPFGWRRRGFAQPLDGGLAGIMLDQEAYDEGLKLLSAEPSVRFAAAYADRRGDLLLAQGKTDEARAAYQQAIDKSDTRSPMRRVIQVKLDALGGAAK